MSGRRAQTDDGQLRLPDWVDGALGAGESARAPRRASAPRRSPAARPSAAANAQTALDLSGADRTAVRHGSRAGSGRPSAAAAPGTANRWLLVVATSLLLLYGIVMAYSASTAQAYFTYGSSFYFLKKQVLFAVVGVAIMLVLARIDYALWRRLAWPVAGFVGFLLLVVLVPGIGTIANGARRWIDIGGASLQPSEFAKPAAVILAAAMVAQRPKDILRFRHLAFVAAAAVLPFAVLILAGKDLSTTGIVIVAAATVLVIAGARWGHLLALAGTLPVLAGMLIAIEPYRFSRFAAFLDPGAHASQGAFQANQALISVAAGQVSGVGLGDSVQKFGYLPMPSSDMIAGIIGEELGLIGILLLVALYLLLALAGLRIARTCREPFGKYVAAGITGAIVVQALLNLAAALGLLPILGIPLPLVSLGGSSMVAVLASIGILLNISTNRRSFIVASPQRRSRAGGGGRNGRPSGARAGGR
jgi:cell division protein FtsW